jgi:hypothetical protein
MGRKNRFREAKARAADDALSALLRAHSRAKTGPRPVETCADLERVYQVRINRHLHLALRAPEDWRCRLRSRAPERRFLDLVRFTFARYPVAQHLENAWVDGIDAAAGLSARHGNQNARAPSGPDFLHWYIIATQGGSLYKQAAHGVMSKLETHHFLNAPEAIRSSQTACWYAFARVHTDSTSVAVRVAQTRLATFPIASSFWKETAQYFARNPIAIPKMNDLIDFLRAAKEADDGFSLSGRTLGSLRRRMAEWHHMLRQRDLVCGGSWDGHPLPDVEYSTGNEHNRAIWRFKQITTGDELFKEGQRMRHCVVTYKPLCIRGVVSIWSLACEYPLGRINHAVTIELRNDGAIAQCRGFANRLPFANEVSVVKRWADEHGLTWHAIAR